MKLPGRSDINSVCLNSQLLSVRVDVFSRLCAGSDLTHTAIQVKTDMNTADCGGADDTIHKSPK